MVRRLGTQAVGQIDGHEGAGPSVSWSNRRSVGQIAGQLVS